MKKSIRQIIAFAWTILAAAVMMVACEKDPLLNTYIIETNGTWSHPEVKPNIIQNALTDRDGNEYDAVRLGNQVWMAQNLRVLMYENGANEVTGYAIPSMQINEFNRQYEDDFGYLYKWDNAMHNEPSTVQQPSGVQGVCPAGWHLPSDAEWDELITFVSQQPEYQCAVGENAIAKALSSTGNWTECNIFGTPGCVQECNNASGFSALPVGDIIGFQDAHFGEFASFWTATESDSENAYCRTIRYNEPTVTRETRSKDVYLAVRCVQD